MCKKKFNLKMLIPCFKIKALKKPQKVLLSLGFIRGKFTLNIKFNKLKKNY